MTDTSFSVKPINGSELPHQASLAAFHHSHSSSRNPIYHAPTHVDIPEDDGQISCICGYADDDGWTVACDLCNRWQHQICYYPGYDERTLPEELQHYCIECRPRDSINIDLARQRQREKRKHPEPVTNGVKRGAAKSHKKKVKENSVSLPNGLHDKYRHDRNSASPRDQPPPLKRPKTTHRASDPANIATTKSTTRKRGASTVNGHRRSLSRSPDSPVEQYSEEFLQCYMTDDWHEVDNNLFTSIGVSNALSEWLNASEEEFQDEHHQTKGEILMRWDGKVEEIPGKAQLEIQEERDDQIQYHGYVPTWKLVTVIEPVANGAYIGELKGHVGFKKDYQHDTSNRWEHLRHPEPFVFFHPKLPIVIDARDEGTELRYVRRSCIPNARLQILVTGGAEYHFCFMAMRQIEPGEEIAVGWDTGDGLPELASKKGYDDEELESLCSWVSTALANCGPCACHQPEQDCMMSRFDRRLRGTGDSHPTKAPKGKKRKTGQHISPINTHALNSRSGSEARRADADDDGSESRSTSGSAGRGSASRDITPNTHYSSNGQSSMVPELSERERKKLAKEEEIFRRQEEEQAGKQAKKKRSSAGTALTTPSASSSRQLGFPANSSKYVDAGTSRQSGIPAKTVAGRKSKSQLPSQKPPMKQPPRQIKRPKPVYVDSGVQCDMEKEEAVQRAPTPSSRRPHVSTRQRLLALCARNNAAVLPSRPAPQKVVTEDIALSPKSIAAEELAAVKSESTPVTSPVAKAGHVQHEVESSHTEDQTVKDVDMEDAPAADDDSVQLPSIHGQAPQLTEGQDTESKPSTMADSSTTEPAEPVKCAVDKGMPLQRSPKMHLEMPPPATNPFAAPVTPLSNGALSAPIVQSPAVTGLTPLLSPSVAAEKTPTAQKTKKMSLSDYMSRRKATKDRDPDSKADRESSPASVASGPIVPPLQPSSSSEARAAEGGSAIDEDVAMEDASSEAVAAA